MTVIDTGKLPTFQVAQAINIAYTEATVRLCNALNLDEFSALSSFTYRIHVTCKYTGEKRVVVYRGGEKSTDPVEIPFDVAISILAIIRLKDYTVSYGKSRQISIFASGGENLSDMDRMATLLEIRPEFGLYALSDVINEDTNVEKEENQKEEKE